MKFVLKFEERNRLKGSTSGPVRVRLNFLTR